MLWIDYPNSLVDLARKIATIRTEMSSHVYSEGSDKYRGDNEKRVSMLGVLGELIAHHYIKDLHSKGKVEFYQFAPLLSFNPVAEPDFTYSRGGQTRIADVKCTDKSSWSINRDAHNNPAKKVDFYLMIQTNHEFSKAFIEFIPYDDVNLWEIRSAYTQFYHRVVHQSHTVNPPQQTPEPPSSIHENI